MAQESVSLVVDTEGEVVDVLEADFEPLPDTVSARIRSFVTGACKIDDDLLLMLDAELMLTVGSE
jgi:purine-binding chemotaxis protein CheW